jgi:hypothetical protein
MLPRRFQLLFVFMLVAAPIFAISYVVPADRFEIERSTAIVAGRVLGSHVEDTPRFGIETITDVVVEDSLKGFTGGVIQIREPGGVLGDEARVIPGVPRFTDGERLLLFLHRRADGEYTVSDLALGTFRLSKDVLTRDVQGWELDGSEHVERQRSAERFIDYIRAVVRGEAAAENYFVAAPGEARTRTSDAVFTATSYTDDVGGGLGARWNVFPSAVNWNQGNSEGGALGSGAAQINSAFATWNSGGTHYVLTSANANANGILDARDGVNNIVFEKDLTSAGAMPFNCATGGVLGMGGAHAALFGSGSHVFHGETFATTLEGDVSMNQGLGVCAPLHFAVGEFHSVIVHELGHTLGFRHSDQNRRLNAPCSTDPTLDCSNQAIMNHILLIGINGVLQPWDHTALNSVYGNGPACGPPSISQQPASVAIVPGNSAQLMVVATGTLPLTYQWFVGPSGDVSMPIGNNNTASIFVSPQVTTSYWVRVTGQCAPTTNSAAAIVTVNSNGCPAVVLGTPQATQVSGGFLLSINAGGGSSFSYRWYDGVVAGGASTIGTANPLLVSPSQTTSYWCRVTNNCNNSADSSVVRVSVACATPQIVGQPKDQQALAGTTVSLTIIVDGPSFVINWFQGTKGDTATPAGSGPTITSPVLTQTTKFWARITSGCGSVDSNAATITVEAGRRRSTRH